jgi:hypothetical protein
VVLNFLGILISTLDYSYQSVAGFRSAISEMHKGWKRDTVRDIGNVHRIMEAIFSKATAKTEVFRHMEPGDIVEISGNTRPIIGTFPHTTLRKAHGSHCAGNHIKVDEKRRYHIIKSFSGRQA